MLFIPEYLETCHVSNQWRLSFCIIPHSMHIQPHGMKSSTIPFIDPLHLCTTFWMLAFRVRNINHARCIQLDKI